MGNGGQEPEWMGMMAHLAEFYAGMTEMLKRSVDYDLIEDVDRLGAYLSVLKDDCKEMSSDFTGEDFLSLGDREKEMEVIARYLVAVSMAFIHLRAIYGEAMLEPLLPMVDGEDGPAERTEIGAREAEERFLKEYMEAYSKQDTEFLSLSVDEWIEANGLLLKEDSDSGGRKAPAKSPGKTGRKTGRRGGSGSGSGGGSAGGSAGQSGQRSVKPNLSVKGAEAVASDSGSGA